MPTYVTVSIGPDARSARPLFASDDAEVAKATLRALGRRLDRADAHAASALVALPQSSGRRSRRQPEPALLVKVAPAPVAGPGAR